MQKKKKKQAGFSFSNVINYCFSVSIRCFGLIWTIFYTIFWHFMDKIINRWFKTIIDNLTGWLKVGNNCVSTFFRSSLSAAAEDVFFTTFCDSAVLEYAVVTEVKCVSLEQQIPAERNAAATTERKIFRSFVFPLGTISKHHTSPSGASNLTRKLDVEAGLKEERATLGGGRQLAELPNRARWSRFSCLPKKKRKAKERIHSA